MILPFTDIAGIEKRKTVKMIPNAIQIHQKSNHKQYFFTSFMSRDRAYQMITDLWWKHHQIKSMEHIQKQQQRISEKNRRNENVYYNITAFDDTTKAITIDNGEGQLAGLQRRRSIQVLPASKKHYQTFWNQDYEWIIAILSIILLLSGISMAYHINSMCRQLMQ